MIVTCSNCNVRLQLDDAKIPARAFTLRCPKCQAIINVQPPANSNGSTEQGALAVGESPSTDHPRFEQPKLAPAFRLEGVEEAGASSAQGGADASDLTRMLLEVLQRAGASADAKGAHGRVAWTQQRKALVCVAPAHREALARVLVTSNYEVYVAADTTQAIERMREQHMDVVILDPEFDPVEQGAAFVTREVNVMRPSERRRLFFVHISQTVRTLDTHAAFINHVNLVLNPVDIESLPQALERALRDYNELYKELFATLNVAAI